MNDQHKPEDLTALLKVRLHNVTRYIETLGDSWKFVEINVTVRDHDGHIIFTALLEDDNQ